MKVLLTGGSGFIGSAVRECLLARGHEVLCVGRRPPDGEHPCSQWRGLDLMQARTPADWLPVLGGCEAVVNAVGLFRETASQRFDTLHTEAPCALFRACAAAGVRRIVQVSALGARADATTAYHLSKHAADSCLFGLPVEGVVVQPSLVFGAEGASSRVLLTLATLPLWLLPGGGRQRVQPVHRDDVAQAIVALLEQPLPALARERCVALVGPAALTFAEYLQALRAGMGLPPAPVLPLPRRLADAVAWVGDRLPGALFTRDSWTMLQQGNTAPADAIARWLGRPPRPVQAFITAREARALGTEAQLRWLLPLLRVSLALVWLWTAIVSFGLYPVHDSFMLLERAGVPAALRPLALYGAAAFDLLLGLWTLRPPRDGRALWAVQAALILAYTVVISLRLPEQWLHPYGPISKNLPMLALLLMLYVFDQAKALRRGRGKGS